MWKQPRSKAGGIRAFFHCWGCGVVALGMPYPWDLCHREGNLHPRSVEQNMGNLEGQRKGSSHPTPATDPCPRVGWPGADGVPSPGRTK